MKIELTIELDVPDKYIFDGEYEEQSINQFVWDRSVHELHMSYLEKLLKANVKLSQAQRDGNPVLISTYEATIKIYSDFVDMYKKCKYKIRKIAE